MSEIKPGDIEALLATFEATSWSEMKVKVDGLELFFSKTPGAWPLTGAHESTPLAPSPSVAPTPAAAPPPLTVSPTKADALPEHWVRVRAPNLGTFYRAPKPGAPPYVEVGQHVDISTELCLIEVMKLFRSVIAGVSGTLRQVLVKDTELVEFDQALFVIEPDA